MLLKVDAAQLEWRVKVFLAQDRVAKKEIIENLDLHTDNATKFGFKGENARRDAKIFLYRMIFSDAFGPQGYAGPAYAYANDPLFMGVSTKTNFWKETIEKFFTKYPEIYQHGVTLIRTAIETGRITSPSGRFYTYSPKANWRGVVDFARSEILNHVVQGFAADLMMVCRRLIKHGLDKLDFGDKCLLINTVHDDVELDCVNDPETVWQVATLLEDAFRMIPTKFEKDFGTVVDIPMEGEVKFGWSLSEPDMTKFKRESFEQDWKIKLDRKLN